MTSSPIGIERAGWLPAGPPDRPSQGNRRLRVKRAGPSLRRCGERVLTSGRRDAARRRSGRRRSLRPLETGEAMNDASLLVRIQGDLTAAMKSRDAETLSTLRMLKAAL